MSPRNYKMTKRASAVEEKRRNIVHATLELHAEKGVKNTGWDEIAARAGVGVGTVYRNFPTLNELLPACGKLTFEKLKLPEPDIFDGLETPAEKLRRLVEELFALYERGEAELRNIREESDYHPVLEEARRIVEERIERLIETAIGRNDPLVRALTDLGTWQALKANQIAEPAKTMSEIICRMLMAVA